nr:reverse transcriptase domain-containing protein [Tanacetum cinerariifolium]
PYTAKCNTCKKVGHLTKNCRNKGPATGSNLLPVTVTYHSCGEKGHYANQCRKTTNNNAQGRSYMLRDRNAHQNPNVLTDEFVNKLVVENCKAKSSKEEPKAVRKNDDAPIIEEWVLDNKEEDVSQPKIEKKTVRPSIAKIEFVKPRQQKKSARKTVKQGNPQMDLQDLGVIDSGCSRHMTGNMSYLADYKEIDRGYVAFGWNLKGWKITGKGLTLEAQLHARVDGKKIIIIKASIRKDLQLADEEGVDCLPNSTIFEQLSLMGMIRNLDNVFGKFLMYLRVRKGFSRRVTPLFPTMVIQSELGEGSAMLTDPHHTPTILQPSSSQPQKSHKLKKPKIKDTQVHEPNGPTDNVADETVHKELGDSLVRAATTASSLGVEQDIGGGPRWQETMGDTTTQTRFESISKHFNESLLARGNTFQSDEDRMKLNELMALCTTLQNRVLELKKTKSSQHNEITSLKKRVMKLEKRNRSRTHKLKRLYKVGLSARVESSDDEESLGVEEVFAAARQNEYVVNITTKELTWAQALEALKTSKPKPKKKDQIRLDEEAAKRLQAEFDEEERLNKVGEQKRKESRRRADTREYKKQNVEDDKEIAELKLLMETILDKKEVVIDVIPLAVQSPKIVDWKIYKEEKKRYYQIVRANKKSQMYIVFSQMLKIFDMEDLEDLYKLVKAIHRLTILVEDLDLILLSDLKLCLNHM